MQCAAPLPLCVRRKSLDVQPSSGSVVRRTSMEGSSTPKAEPGKPSRRSLEGSGDGKAAPAAAAVARARIGNVASPRASMDVRGEEGQLRSAEML